MTRQIEESSRIEGEEEEKLLNTRQEWQSPLLSRIVVDLHTSIVRQIVVHVLL